MIMKSGVMEAVVSFIPFPIAVISFVAIPATILEAPHRFLTPELRKERICRKLVKPKLMDSTEFSNPILKRRR